MAVTIPPLLLAILITYTHGKSMVVFTVETYYTVHTQAKLLSRMYHRTITQLKKATTLASHWLSGCPEPPHTEAAITLASHWLSGCPEPPHTEAAITLAFYWLSGCPDPPPD